MLVISIIIKVNTALASSCKLPAKDPYSSLRLPITCRYDLRLGEVLNLVQHLLYLGTCSYWLLRGDTVHHTRVLLIIP